MCREFSIHARGLLLWSCVLNVQGQSFFTTLLSFCTSLYVLMLFTEQVTFEVSWSVLFSSFFVMPLNNMGNMDHNISQNLFAILAVTQNRNNIESWPKYRNTIESLHFCQFPPLMLVTKLWITNDSDRSMGHYCILCVSTMNGWMYFTE